MTVTFRNSEHKEEKNYKTMRGVNNFVDRHVENYDLTLEEKKFKGTGHEVWIYKGGAGWQVTFHVINN